MVLSALLIYSIGIPADIVIGRIVPAVGIAVLLGNIYYAYMGRKLAMKEQRSDVTALPYGTSVGHMFIVTYLVIGPVYWKTKDPILAWQIGLSWCFLESLTQVIVSFIVIKVRSITPRAAMLGTMAGLSLTLIAMKPMAQVWKNPITAFAGFALALVDFFGRKRLLGNFPAASATDR